MRPPRRWSRSCGAPGWSRVFPGRIWRVPWAGRPTRGAGACSISARRAASPGRLAPAERPAEVGEIIALGRGGNPAPATDRLLRGLEGIVLLDGTWSQAKTLWWRNPWLLKLQRIVLNPPSPARLGRLRREPRREALSTLEAAALVLRHTEPGPAAADALLAALDRLIATCAGRPVPATAYDSDHSPGPFPRRVSGRRRRSRGISAAE